MPGFNILGSESNAANLKTPQNITETRRKHRWIFQLNGTGAGGGRGPLDNTALVLLKSCSRPKLTLEEPVMHHNQEQAYFAGKQSWDPITMSWYDAEQNPDVSGQIYYWLENVVNMDTIVVSAPTFYKYKGALKMLDGAGTPSETWTLFGCWPKDVNWGDLSYEDSEIATIEVTMRYDRAVRRPGNADI